MPQLLDIPTRTSEQQAPSIRILSLEAPNLVDFLTARHEDLSLRLIDCQEVKSPNGSSLDEKLILRWAVLSGERAVGEYHVVAYTMENIITRQEYKSADESIHLIWDADLGGRYDRHPGINFP